MEACSFASAFLTRTAASFTASEVDRAVDAAHEAASEVDEPDVAKALASGCRGAMHVASGGRALRMDRDRDAEAHESFLLAQARARARAYAPPQATYSLPRSRGSSRA